MTWAPPLPSSASSTAHQDNPTAHPPLVCISPSLQSVYVPPVCSSPPQSARAPPQCPPSLHKSIPSVCISSPQSVQVPPNPHEPPLSAPPICTSPPSAQAPHRAQLKITSLSHRDGRFPFLPGPSLDAIRTPPPSEMQFPSPECHPKLQQEIFV